MPSRTYMVAVNDRILTVDDDQLAGFARRFGYGVEAVDRISELLWLDMWWLLEAIGVNPHTMVHEIKKLEAVADTKRGTKDESQFVRPLLKGLWHKHFFSAHFIAKNIKNEFVRGRLNKLINYHFAGDGASYNITPDNIREFSREAVQGTIMKRDEDKRLTGEWIVYDKYEGKNYYLCFGTHDGGDDYIAARIHEHCKREFPFLPFFTQP